MAKTTEFDHDTLGHLLADNHLKVPRFQREYSWTEDNVSEYWNDIMSAREEGQSYFLGTVVLADTEHDDQWRIIVDGQQRIATTALTYVAIIRKLHEIGKHEASREVTNTHIASYNLREEDVVPKLEFSAEDQLVYSELVHVENSTKETVEKLTKENSKSNILTAFKKIIELIDDKLTGVNDYDELIGITEYLHNDAQVLLAIANGLSEAYVIFETLNDRGADLTTTDLLKNYLLSGVGNNKVDSAAQLWTQVASKFDTSQKLLAFIKAHYISNWGFVKNKTLYRELQGKLEGSRSDKSNKIMKYLKSLELAYPKYEALKSSDAAFWSSIATDIRDEIIAQRRFHFETPVAMYMAAMEQWKPKDFCNLIQVGTGWAVRASLAGTLGGGTAEKLYANLAEKIANGEIKSVSDARKIVQSVNFLPDDNAFKTLLANVTDNNLSRVKYYLAMIQAQYCKNHNLSTESLPAWDNRTVTVEHIIAYSKDFGDEAEDNSKTLSQYQHSLANLTLLERTINNTKANDKPFAEKKELYAESAFPMTKSLSNLDDFDAEAVRARNDELLELATQFWAI
ncbi:DUF262 domain-containing HNH endonuclease family protein [Corynebacterium sp.]|uniref:DUF262 domain-containing protein n=1 Tax=Corynebacterium sp. TaxID=1720 RepID=UPI0029052C47|nr:DUF262 domain-containing HNH endonuclease family protein [Corynebacterium sp.]MDU3111075.1 DUF262 domain-containing HNH endonuclease family protein [Corynebacterium sp.]